MSGGEPLAVGGTRGDAARVLASAVEFQLGTLERVAEKVVPIEQGWVIRQPSLPLVWSVNQVRVTKAIDYTDAVALVEEHLRDASYRQLVVQHEASGRRLEPIFRADGWEVEREVVMALLGGPDRALHTSGVIEVGEEDAIALMRRWADEDPELDLSPEGLRQVAEFSRRAWRERGARRFGVLGSGGALAAITMLFSDGATAQVEDVYTVPEERGRGFGRASVTRAAIAAVDAGHELTFIVADDNDWPKHLYAQIGFVPVGWAWLFHRELRG